MWVLYLISFNCSSAASNFVPFVPSFFTKFGNFSPCVRKTISEIASFSKNTHDVFKFAGQSGQVQFTKHGDRVPTYVFENVIVDEEGTRSSVLFDYNSFNSRPVSIVVRDLKLRLHEVVWPNGRNGSGEIPVIKERIIDGKLIIRCN